MKLTGFLSLDVKFALPFVSYFANFSLECFAIHLLAYSPHRDYITIVPVFSSSNCGLRSHAGQNYEDPQQEKANGSEAPNTDRRSVGVSLGRDQKARQQKM